jgi:hypothetical protein
MEGITSLPSIVLVLVGRLFEVQVFVRQQTQKPSAEINRVQHAPGIVLLDKTLARTERRG